jgi:hypothetical protein
MSDRLAELNAEAEKDADFFDHPAFSLEDVLGLMDMERGQIARHAHAALLKKKAAAEGSEQHRKATEEYEWNTRRYAVMSLAQHIVRKRRKEHADASTL